MNLSKKSEEEKFIKKIDSLSKTLKLVSEEIDNLKSNYENEREGLSEPFRFFSEIYFISNQD